MNIQLLLIDPQNDFCDPSGALYVPGAEVDMARVAGLLDEVGDAISGVHVTLDTHARWDIAHPIWWRDEQGRVPAPFTQIELEDVECGRYATARSEDREPSLRYLRELKLAGRFTHTLWPEHCLAGDWGSNIFPALSRALHAWEQGGRRADLVRKGENPHTEHFSAVRAEVPDRWDPATQPNDGFVSRLERADVILVGGEAATHCVLNTVLDLAAAFVDSASVRKLVWIEDATSPVPDPPGTRMFSDPLLARQTALCAAGMRRATTTQVQAALRRAA